MGEGSCRARKAALEVSVFLVRSPSPSPSRATPFAPFPLALDPLEPVSLKLSLISLPRYRFSTRNQNVSRPRSTRQSLVESITVETQASKWEESALPPIPIPDEALRNLHLNQQRRESDSTSPPPVPPKDDSPSCGSTQWFSSAVGGQANLGTKSH